VEVAALKGAGSQVSGRAEMEVPRVAGGLSKRPVRATAGRRRNSVRSVPFRSSVAVWLDILGSWPSCSGSERPFYYPGPDFQCGPKHSVVFSFLKMIFFTLVSVYFSSGQLKKRL
jgi:hypothetical protein